MAFEMENNNGLIKCVAAVTKWLDMGASGNLYYSKGDRKMSDTVRDILTATRYGWKSFYYDNTNDGDDQGGSPDMKEQGCEGGVCSL